MNLRVDLILPSEQRSGTLVNVKSLLRIGSIVLPAAIGLYMASAVFGLIMVSTELKGLEEDVTRKQPKVDEADKVMKELNANMAILNEFKAWRSAQTNWCEQLLGLQQVIPTNAQLTSLEISHALAPDKRKRITSRTYSLNLRGIALGKGAEKSLRKLKSDLEEGRVFPGMIEEVSLKGSRLTGGDHNPKYDRSFQIRCEFYPIEFK